MKTLWRDFFLRGSLTGRWLKTCRWGLCLAAVVLPLQQAVAEPIVIRFSHVVGPNTPKGIGAQRFKTLVEQKLPGKVRVEIYGGGSRFNDEQAILALLFGEIELAAPSFSKFRAVSNEMMIFDVPFLFKNRDALKRFQAGPSGQRLLDSMLGRGLKGLAYWDNGPRVIATKRPVKAPGDLRGLTFRIEPSAVIERQYRSLGGVPITMPFGRVRDAARSGLISGQENAWSNILSKGLHEFHPHFAEVGHTFLGYMLVTGTAFWDGLPSDVRGELVKIIDQVTEEVNTLALEKHTQSRSKVLESGKAQVFTPTDAQRVAWEEAFAPVREAFADRIGRQLLNEAVGN